MPLKPRWTNGRSRPVTKLASIPCPNRTLHIVTRNPLYSCNLKSFPGNHNYMIAQIPTPKTDNLDEFFQNEAIQNMMQLGTATPMPARRPSGAPGVSFCFRETSEYIRQLKKTKFGIKYGRFVVNNVHIFKVMLLIVLDDTGAKHSIVEMDINWHDLVTGQDVITALATGGPMFLRCYGDNWTCEKLIQLSGDEGLEAFAQAFISQVEDTQPWQAVDFGHAASTIASKYDIHELLTGELPKQMASFEKSGDFDSKNISSKSEVGESTEQRRARHSEFLQHHCKHLAAFGWEGYSIHGPGVVMVKQNGSGCKIRYVTAAEADADETYDSIAVQIGKYDPDTAFVVAIDDSEDFYSSYIIGLPDLTPRMAFEQGLHKCLTV